ncbi:hypothetical protein ACLIA0_04295 [Bacillaceae bacterium W0354]
MASKIDMFENLKKKYVRIALETSKQATTAKAAGVHPDTLRKWMKEYETEVRDEMEQEGVSITPVEPTENDYKKKYELAMKLLGEKELEVAVLQDALKKKNVI